MYFLELDTEVLPVPNDNYIFCPGLLKQVEEEFWWSGRITESVLNRRL
jgi:hypothetical protein